MNQAKTAIRVSLLCACIFGLTQVARSQSYHVYVDKPSRSMSFTSSAPGEAQSTVVPPGLKSQCSAGRFIVTNDLHRPTDGAAVLWRDLNSTAATYSATTFDTIPINSSKIAFKTNDHDIITMPNGDVVLVWGVHFATALIPKPGWFDDTFKGAFGPGVRRGVLAWRSTDCGQSFRYMGKVDPATTDNGSCALPQWRRNPDNSFIKEKPYSNGGVDGQLIKLDPATNKLYLMFQCVGQTPVPLKRPFTLSDNRLNKTMVLSSGDEGATWNMLGWLDTRTWRYGIVPFPQGDLAFGASNFLSFGQKLSNGNYHFDTTSIATPTGSSGWDNFDSTSVSGVVNANVYGHTVITRVPGEKNGVFMSFPDTVEVGGSQANGFRLFFYDRGTNQYGEANPIVPIAKNDKSFTMHMVAIDLGKGPILLYWYDINVATGKGTVRGRLVTGMGEFSDDFAIFSTQPRMVPSGTLRAAIEYFDLGSSPYWYGDYKTAGGYTHASRFRAQRQTPPLTMETPPTSYNYSPMWVEPDKTVRYAHVTVEAVPTTDSLHLNLVRIPQWRPAPPPVELLQRKWSPAEQRDILDYGKRSVAPR